MSRNSNGTMTLPVGNPVITGTVIESVWANTTMSDMANEMTDSLSRTGKGGMLAALKNVDGTVGVPAYSYTNEFDSGWYRAGDGDHRLSIKGVDAFNIVEGVTWNIQSGDYLFNGVGLELDGDDLYIGDKATGEKVLTDADVLIADNIDYAALDTPLMHLPFTSNETTRIINGQLSATRASGGTYIDIYDKLVYSPAPAANNLALWSEDFSNAAWTKTGVTLSDVLDPKGGTNADLLTTDTSTGVHSASQSFDFVAGTTYAVSLLARADGYNLLRVQFPTSAFGETTRVTFDLSSGSGSEVNNANYNIETSGSGYYRVSFTATCTATVTATIQLYIQSLTTTSFTGDGVNGIAYYGFQLENSRVANGYVKTEAVSVSANSTFGIDQLRIEKEGALIEGASTNEILWSEDYTNASWNKLNTTAVISSDESPLGLFAYNVAATANGGIVQGISGGKNIGDVFTSSIWIKRRSGTGDISIQAGTTDLLVIPVTTDWQRVEQTGNPLTDTTARCSIYFETSGDSVYMIGSQLEKLPFASSYIPTTSSSSSRAGDIVSCAVNNNLIGALNGAHTQTFAYSLFGETGLDQKIYEAQSDVPQSNRFLIAYSNGVSGISYRDGSTAAASIVSTIGSEHHIAAVTNSTTDKLVYSDGVAGVTNTTLATEAIGQTTLFIGNNVALTNPMYGHLKDFRVYDFALTASQVKFLGGNS